MFNNNVGDRYSYTAVLGAIWNLQARVLQLRSTAVLARVVYRSWFQAGAMG